MPTFNKFVQIGRVVLHNNGRYEGKLSVVVDVVDHHRILVDGPQVPRHVESVNDVTLTSIVLHVARTVTHAKLSEVFTAEKVADRFKESSLAKKIEKRHIRANMTDFDRFRVMVAKHKRNSEVRKQVKLIKRLRGKTRVTARVPVSEEKTKAKTAKTAAKPAEKKAAAKK
eukprot:c7872_g1_i1.p1 GENE.c7872_g1_i1~~c7872_g1_i1.p1  ORF type:complete len:170 (+),score=47.09 c7872_g1_i1:39-548(+)